MQRCSLESDKNNSLLATTALQHVHVNELIQWYEFFCGCVVQLSLFTKILHGHCFQFLLGVSSNEKQETMVMQNFRQENKPGGRVVLRISGDGNDEIFYSGIFFGRKIWVA